LHRLLRLATFVLGSAAFLSAAQATFTVRVTYYKLPDGPGHTAGRPRTATTGPREIDPQRSAWLASQALQNTELMSKSEHLNLKRQPRVRAQIDRERNPRAGGVACT
jgi:hypothetical protein